MKSMKNCLRKFLEFLLKPEIISRNPLELVSTSISADFFFIILSGYGFSQHAVMTSAKHLFNFCKLFFSKSTTFITDISFYILPTVDKKPCKGFHRNMSDKVFVNSFKNS